LAGELDDVSAADSSGNLVLALTGELEDGEGVGGHHGVLLASGPRRGRWTEIHTVRWQLAAVALSGDCRQAIGT